MIWMMEINLFSMIEIIIYKFLEPLIILELYLLLLEIFTQLNYLYVKL